MTSLSELVSPNLFRTQGHKCRVRAFLHCAFISATLFRSMLLDLQHVASCTGDDAPTGRPENPSVTLIVRVGLSPWERSPTLLRNPETAQHVEQLLQGQLRPLPWFALDWCPCLPPVPLLTVVGLLLPSFRVGLTFAHAILPFGPAKEFSFLVDGFLELTATFLETPRYSHLLFELPSNPCLFIAPSK